MFIKNLLNSNKLPKHYNFKLTMDGFLILRNTVNILYNILNVMVKAVCGCIIIN